MTMPDDVLAYNRQLIATFRADAGASIGDRPLLLLTTRGRRSGEPRTSPIMYVRADGRLFVVASNAGAAEDPQWYRNLLADPAVTVELPGETFPARATPLSGEDYERQWDRITGQHAFFLEHQQRAGDRRIPIVELHRD
ncbi:nitroreductase/quinone reductase family protein [Nucisporomicrobium flavum]|uniref:nitroreductase/quinone reductase family protein n=1 Tax=Nucisporomicrobium flavum TaxID=2785915 RepID=UPI0018F700DE|nr:nitroreductase/quinone reductase family protein [Nucisporomicrobium flavum]